MNTETARSSEKATFSIHVSQALKGIAILLMLFHHLFGQSETFEDVYGVIFRPFTRAQVNLASSGAAICVTMFAFLTGYGMTLALRQKNNRERELYAVRHYFRLEVSFLVVFAASLLTSPLRSDHLAMYFADGKASAVRYILTDALGFSTFAGTPGYNETWWYISYAVFLILLMPVITTAVQRYGIAVVALAGMIKSFGVDAGKPFARFLLAVTLGAWLADRDALGWLKSRLTGLPRRILFLAATLFLALGGYAVHLRMGLNPWANAFVVLMVVLFLYALVDLCGVRLRLLEFIGTYSMNIFLVHTLIYERYFTALVYAPKHFILVELLLLVLSLAVSIPLNLVQDLLLRRLGLKKARAKKA